MKFYSADIEMFMSGWNTLYIKSPLQPFQSSFLSAFSTHESQHFGKDVNDRPYFNVGGSNRFDSGTLFA
jgi:hypothetical protein